PLLSRSLLHLVFPVPAHPGVASLSLHDALPILGGGRSRHEPAADGLFGGSIGLRRCGAEGLDDHRVHRRTGQPRLHLHLGREREDRKSTRLNSSHVSISYAVFCLKKKTEYITSL